MSRRLSPIAAWVAALSLAACGGGSTSGGGTTGGTTPPPANRAPVFTSAATAASAENATGTVYTAAAIDADGNAITYSITGGADAARFRITASGALTFSTAPDFEDPFDADTNNVYNVSLGASDGSLTTTIDLAVTVTNAGPDAFRMRRASTAFVQLLYLTAYDGTRVLVVEKGGRVRIFNAQSGVIVATPFLDVSGQISTSGEQGLLGLALAPDFATSRNFYVYLNNLAGNIEVRRYRTLAANPNQADPASADVILTIPHPTFDNHNGGWIDFGPDGFLWIATGDGGGSGDPASNAQSEDSLLGKMLRIDVSRDAFPTEPLRDYAIPDNNRFRLVSFTEIYAMGLRNPFRAGFDRVTGNLYVGDVGQDAVEEVDLIPPNNGNPSFLNFGWRLREGTQAYNGGANSSGFTAPIAEYGHGSGPLQGRSVTGGYVYRGPVEALNGLYFFGDFVTGNLWTIPVRRFAQGTTLTTAAFTNRASTITPDLGTINNIASFGTDASGNLYIIDFDGEIYIIEAA